MIGVEPRGAAKMTASLAAGRPVSLDRVASLADGLLPVRPGDLTFHHVQRFVDDMVTVDDDPIADAVLWLFRRAKLVVETSGAATLAALLTASAPDPSSQPPGSGATVVVLSGGNLGVETLAQLAAARPSPGSRG